MSEKRGEGRPCWYEDGYDGLYIMALAIYRFHLSSKEILTDFGISQVPYLPDVVHLHLLHGEVRIQPNKLVHGSCTTMGA